MARKNILQQSDIVKLISHKTHIKDAAVRAVLRQLTIFMAVAMENNQSIQLGMGKFSLQLKRRRQVHDFQTNTRYMSNPNYTIKYTPSSYIKKKVIQKQNTKLKAELDLQEKEQENGD